MTGLALAMGSPWAIGAPPALPVEETFGADVRFASSDPLDGETAPAIEMAGHHETESTVRSRPLWGIGDGGALLYTATDIVEPVFAPPMLGDFIGTLYFGPPPGPDRNVIRSPQAVASQRAITRFKAADNQSPRPQTRVFGSYNYFSDSFETSVDINRPTGGVEVVIVPDFSFQFVAPVNILSETTAGDEDTRFGDIRLQLKALIAETADGLVSLGCGLSLPTADRQQGLPGGISYWSPFLGYIYSPFGKRWFIQGFQQIDVPFHDIDSGMLHTDVGFGFWLMRPRDDGGVISGVVPTLELHGYNPLFGKPKEELQGLIYNDVLNVTLGNTFLFWQDRASVALGVGFPLTERHDYEYELHCHANWRF